MKALLVTLEEEIIWVSYFVVKDCKVVIYKAKKSFLTEGELNVFFLTNF